jgi:hypothetical protein
MKILLPKKYVTWTKQDYFGDVFLEGHLQLAMRIMHLDLIV